MVIAELEVELDLLPPGDTVPGGLVVTGLRTQPGRTQSRNSNLFELAVAD